MTIRPFKLFSKHDGYLVSNGGKVSVDCELSSKAFIRSIKHGRGTKFGLGWGI
jgi:hypothetical protein